MAGSFYRVSFPGINQLAMTLPRHHLSFKPRNVVYVSTRLLQMLLSSMGHYLQGFKQSEKQRLGVNYASRFYLLLPIRFKFRNPITVFNHGQPCNLD